MNKRDMPNPQNKGQNPSNLREALSLLLTIVALIPLISALLYFCGRLYIDSYYRTLGITDGALSFSIEEYMFSSVPTLLLLLGLSVSLATIYYTETKREYPSRVWALMLFFLAIVSPFLIVYFHPFAEAYYNYVNALIFGLCIGVSLTALYWLISSPGIQVSSEIKDKLNTIIVDAGDLRVDKERHKMQIRVKLIVMAIYLFCFIPVCVNYIASSNAETVRNSLLPVTINYYSDNNHSAQVRQVTGNMTIINNNWAYIIQNSSDNWSSFSVKLSDVQNITYGPFPK